MDDAVLVRGVERRGELAGDRHRLVEGQRAARDALGERRPLDQFEDERALAARRLFDPVDLRDVGGASEASTCASRSKRASRSASAAKRSGRILSATSRCRRESRARYTSPMPPAPRGETIS
jgi:hypothetical protein